MKPDFSARIESFKKKTDKERLDFLFDFWKISEQPNEDGSFKVVASYQYVGKDKNGYDFGYFVDVRSLNGDILYYPFLLGPITIYVSHNDAYTKEPLWQISVRLSTKTKYRETNPFLLELSDKLFGKPKNSFVDRLGKEKLIRDLFNKRGATIDDAQIIANALNILIGDVRTDSERFLFELLQNADDQPYANGPVNVTFKTLTEHLLVLHNGNPFSSNDVQVISSIGDKSSNKISDKEKTGYKGIGFKSVFSDSDTVFIDSGGFSFAFDKNSPVYNKVPDINAIPWQIKPIWQERYRLPKEVAEEQDYFTSRVGIALNAGLENIANYNSIIPNLLTDPRFMLFLRHIEAITFESNRESIVATKKSYGEKVVVGNSSNNTEWIVKDFEFEIPQSLKEKLAVDGGNKIPQKLKTATRTKISFAINYTGNKIERVEKSLLFTYLPTKVDEFRFPFLINADFIVNSSREYVHDDNIWNKFLFEYIGRETIEWVKSISDKEDYLKALPTLTESSDSQLFLTYSDAYKAALESESFILNHKGELARQDEIIIDTTGLSEIVGYELFCQLLGTEKCLPSKNIGINVLSEKLFEHITNVEFDEIINSITSNDDFNEWFISATDVQRDSLYDWIGKNIKTREAKLAEFISGLPVLSLKFADRKTMFFALKEILDIDKLKEIALFKNMNGDLQPLEEMAPYRDGVESWLRPYIICEEECFEELSAYLISEYRFIKDVVFEHLDEYDGYLSDLKDKYNWTDEDYTKKLIYKYHNDFEKYKEILPIAKKSGKEIQEYYLLWLKVSLSKDKSYNADTFEYQVLQLALSIYENPSEFTSKIFYDNKCLKDYTITPEVERDYYSSDGKKTLKLKLSELLPEYQNQTNPTEEIKKLFEPRIKDLDEFLLISLNHLTKYLKNYTKMSLEYTINE